MNSRASTLSPLEKQSLQDAVRHRLKYDFAKEWEERSGRAAAERSKSWIGRVIFREITIAPAIKNTNPTRQITISRWLKRYRPAGVRFQE